MKVNNKKFQKDDVVVIGRDDELDVPEFGQILSVLVDGPTVIFNITILDTIQYVEHFHAFAVRHQAGRKHLVLSSELKDIHPYILYRSPVSSVSVDRIYYVVLK